MKKAAIIWGILLIAAFTAELLGAAHDDIWTLSELLSLIAENRFVLVLVSWFVGFVMGHALAPVERGQ